MKALRRILMIPILPTIVSAAVRVQGVTATVYSKTCTSSVQRWVQEPMLSADAVSLLVEDFSYLVSVQVLFLLWGTRDLESMVY